MLRRALADGDERFAELVGAASFLQRWCYPEWARRLAGEPQQRRRVLAAMASHPESGFAEALAPGGETTAAARLSAA